MLVSNAWSSLRVVVVVKGGVAGCREECRRGWVCRFAAFGVRWSAPLLLLFAVG